MDWVVAENRGAWIISGQPEFCLFYDVELFKQRPVQKSAKVQRIPVSLPVAITDVIAIKATEFIAGGVTCRGSSEFFVAGFRLVSG
jgi:hypothetical protein